MRTSSEPARAREATCWIVDSTSAVSVLVIDWTTTGASDPTRMPPMLTVTAWRRWIAGMCSFYQSSRDDNACGMLRLKAQFAASRFETGAGTHLKERGTHHEVAEESDEAEADG